MERSKGTKVAQILLLILGMIFFAISTYLFASALSLIFEKMKEVDDLGQAVGMAVGLAFTLFFLIISCGCSFVFGGITVIISALQRRKPETKDKFSLTLLIMGITIMIDPIYYLILYLLTNFAK